LPPQKLRVLCPSLNTDHTLQARRSNVEKSGAGDGGNWGDRCLPGGRERPGGRGWSRVGYKRKNKGAPSAKKKKKKAGKTTRLDPVSEGFCKRGGVKQ